MKIAFSDGSRRPYITCDGYILICINNSDGDDYDLYRWWCGSDRHKDIDYSCEDGSYRVKIIGVDDI
jgi:hypothetical protein